MTREEPALTGEGGGPSETAASRSTSMTRVNITGQAWTRLSVLHDR